MFVLNENLRCATQNNVLNIPYYVLSKNRYNYIRFKLNLVLLINIIISPIKFLLSKKKNYELLLSILKYCIQILKIVFFYTNGPL